MKLEIGNVNVKDVLLGSENSFKDGILTIDKQGAIDYLKGEDDHITELDIVIAHPGDDTRIVPVIETIEPRVRMDGRCVFPGVTDEVVPAGDGELKAAKGTCVTVVGKEWGSFGDGVIDMGGEGAKHTYWSKLINICLVGDTDEEFERHEQQKCNHALRWAGHRLAEYVGKIIKDVDADETETYVFDPVLKRDEARKDLPNVAIVLQPQSQMEAMGYNDLLYGWDMNHFLPTFLSLWLVHARLLQVVDVRVPELPAYQGALQARRDRLQLRGRHHVQPERRPQPEGALGGHGAQHRPQPGR